jgi:uncharacterized glyoxalase superfamily protein PhnB
MSSKEMTNPNSVGLTSKDMKATLAFYRDKLGFTLRECWPNEAEPMWMSLTLDKQSVMFGAAMPADACAQMMENDPTAAKFWSKKADDYAKHPHGVGVNTYLMVPDIDAYAKQIEKRGVKADLPPTTQFYGLRNIVVSDPDGYVLTFYTPIKMSSCQSCGMPLTDAQPGQMYCGYCTDEKGKLRPYEQVLEGTTSGYFMQMQKMPRKDAEKAAREHLAKMPAWAANG